MARGGGIALKALQWFLRVIEFCCAAIILGIFSYFLATLHNHGLHIQTWIRAVEGISGAGVLYTLIALVFLWCLAGVAFFSTIAIILDVCFIGAFIYVAYATRGGDGSCNGFVRTAFGNGNTQNSHVPNGRGGFTALPSLHTTCRLETACFAVAIVAIVFFLISILVELALIRHHEKEKAFGPSPNNGYTAGTPRRRFWRRKSRRDAEYAAGGLAAEKRHPDALPVHASPADVRASYATDTTAVGTEQPVYSKYGNTTTPLATHERYGVRNDGFTGHPSKLPANGYQTQQPYDANPTGTL